MRNCAISFVAIGFFAILPVLIPALAIAEKPHIVFLISEDEYNTKETLPKFAAEVLEPNGYRCLFVHGSEADSNRFENLDLLDEADLLFVSVRRKTPPTEQMKKIKAICKSGIPIVAIRTSSHAFALREGDPPEGHADWPEFDADVLGGNYHNHHGNKAADAPKTTVWIDDTRSRHPIVKGLKQGEFHTASWLYKAEPLEDRTIALMWGRVEDRKPHEPVTWTHQYKGSKVFYTSLGTAAEFEGEFLPKLLLNGINWALDEDRDEASESSECAVESKPGD